MFEIIGVRDVFFVIEIIKKEFILCLKFEKILGEVKVVVVEMDVLKEENERLCRENEKFKDVFKMFF